MYPEIDPKTLRSIGQRYMWLKIYHASEKIFEKPRPLHFTRMGTKFYSYGYLEFFGSNIVTICQFNNFNREDLTEHKVITMNDGTTYAQMNYFKTVDFLFITDTFEFTLTFKVEHKYTSEYDCISMPSYNNINLGDIQANHFKVKAPIEAVEHDLVDLRLLF